MSLAPALVLVVSLVAGTNHAPSADEQRLFAAGLAAFEAGDARGAERAWKEGYAIARDPAFLVRIGEAQEKAGLPAEAADSYHRYLREAPDASDRADIEQRLARLGPPAGRPRAAAPDNAEPVSEFGAAPSTPATPGMRAPAADAEAARAAQDDEDARWTPARIAAWSATGLTAALLGVAAYFGAQASSEESDVNRLLVFRDEQTGARLSYTPEVARKYETALADGRHDARVAKFALLGAAGTAAVATVFFVIGAHAPAEGVALAPTPGRGAMGLWTWRF